MLFLPAWQGLVTADLSRVAGIPVMLQGPQSCCEHDWQYRISGRTSRHSSSSCSSRVFTHGTPAVPIRRVFGAH